MCPHDFPAFLRLISEVDSKKAGTLLIGSAKTAKTAQTFCVGRQKLSLRPPRAEILQEWLRASTLTPGMTAPVASAREIRGEGRIISRCIGEKTPLPLFRCPFPLSEKTP